MPYNDSIGLLQYRSISKAVELVNEAVHDCGYGHLSRSTRTQAEVLS